MRTDGSDAARANKCATGTGCWEAHVMDRRPIRFHCNQKSNSVHASSSTTWACSSSAVHKYKVRKVMLVFRNTSSHSSMIRHSCCCCKRLQRSRIALQKAKTPCSCNPLLRSDSCSCSRLVPTTHLLLFQCHRLPVSEQSIFGFFPRWLPTLARQE